MGPCENIGVHVCSHCEGEGRKKLCDDLSGQHTSVIPDFDSYKDI